MDVSLSRDILRDILQEGHARGWAIWKALITSVQLRGTDPRKAKKAFLDRVQTDHDFYRRHHYIAVLAAFGEIDWPRPGLRWPPSI